MYGEVTLFTKPEELVAWLEDNDILMNIQVEDAQLLLDYMEDHDYAVGMDADGKMIRKDVTEEQGEVEAYTIDDLIDAASEWNYELIREADEQRQNPKDFIDFCNEQSRYERLLEEEKRLDVMFDKTIYGAKIAELGTRLAYEFIERLSQGKSVEECVSRTVGEMKQVRTGNRGR